MQNKNSQIITEFLEYLQNIQQYSPATIRAYRTDLFQFSNFNKHSILKTDRNQIQLFMQDMGRKKVMNNTMARKLASIKSLYKYLSINKIIDVNITNGIRAPKIPKRLPHLLSQKEITTLLDYPYGEKYSDFRDKLILELFYSSGLRISELVKIKLDDIQLESKTIRIVGKGNKERVVIFGLTVQSIIKNYLINRENKFNNYQNPYLFPTYIKSNSKVNGHIAIRTVFNIVKKYICKVSNDEKMSPHSLRHSFASHLLDNGADLMAVKDLLGHSSLSSTQVYTHVKINKLNNVYKNAHPHAK